MQLDIASPPSFNEIGGYGNFYWTLATNLRVYEVGNSAATVTTFSNVRRGIPALSPFEEQFSGGAPVRLVDLRGSAPSVLEVTPPVDEGVLAFSTNADSWVQRTGSFVRGFPGGQPRQYGLGSVLDIAAGANHAAVATTDGKIRVFDLDTRALLATLEEPDPKLAMTADGDTLLVMRKTGNDRGLRFYALPSGNLLDEWQFTSGVNGQVYLLDFTLARSADRVALALATDGTNQTSSEVRRFDGTVDYSSSTVNFLTLSPNGNRAAVAAGRRTLTPTTSIFTGGTITAATQGYATGWIDDDRMLVNFYRRVSTSFIDFDHAKIVDAAGTVLATLTTLPEIEELQPVSSSAIYSRVHNQIFNVDTGTVVWTGSRGGFIGDLYPNAYGAVAAGRVVHAGIDLPVVRVEMH